MKEPILFRRDDTLNHEQALYWKDLLYRTVKIGTEVEFAMPKGVRKDDFMPVLVEALQPTRDLTNLGRYGVLDVIGEHCGLEIQIIGRQPYYPALLQQYHDLFALLPPGIRARPTCGLHYHALAIGLASSRFSPVVERYLRARKIGEDSCLMLYGAAGQPELVRSILSCARSVCRRYHGVVVGSGPGRHWLADRFRHPYMRDALLDAGYATDDESLTAGAAVHVVEPLDGYFGATTTLAWQFTWPRVRLRFGIPINGEGALPMLWIPQAFELYLLL